MKAATPAHVFWLGVLANLVAGVIGMVALGWWRNTQLRRLRATVDTAAGLFSSPGDAPRRRRRG